MLYSVTEAGVYRVAFYCDIQVRYDESSQTLRVCPLEGIPPVTPKATLSSLTGQGYYRSRSAFQSAGLHTRIIVLPRSIYAVRENVWDTDFHGLHG